MESGNSTPRRKACEKNSSLVMTCGRTSCRHRQKDFPARPGIRRSDYLMRFVTSNAPRLRKRCPLLKNAEGESGQTTPESELDTRRLEPPERGRRLRPKNTKDFFHKLGEIDPVLYTDVCTEVARLRDECPEANQPELDRRGARRFSFFVAHRLL